MLLQGRCACIDRFHSEMIERDQGENEMRRLLVSTTVWWRPFIRTEDYGSKESNDIFQSPGKRPLKLTIFINQSAGKFCCTISHMCF
jgi:hypothetical protein